MLNESLNYYFGVIDGYISTCAMPARVKLARDRLVDVLQAGMEINNLPPTRMEPFKLEIKKKRSAKELPLLSRNHEIYKKVVRIVSDYFDIASGYYNWVASDAKNSVTYSMGIKERGGRYKDVHDKIRAKINLISARGAEIELHSLLLKAGVESEVVVGRGKRRLGYTYSIAIRVRIYVLRQGAEQLMCG